MPIVPLLSIAEPDTDHLPPLPAARLALLAPWWPTLIAWFSTLLYRAVGARCRHHPLVRLHQHYDPHAVVQACAAFHHPTGPGAPPTHPVAVLVRCEIVRVWANSCSDRVLERLLASDLVVRWFVGLPLLAPTPDHTTLSRFHAWRSVHQPQTWFQDVLAFLDRVDPEDAAATPQVVDTFALASPAAPTSAARVLLALCGQLVQHWQQHASPALQHVVPPLDLGALLHPPAAHTARARQAQLHQAGTLATWLLDALTPHTGTLDPPAQAWVAHQVGLLAKVLADETTWRDDQYVERPAGQKGTYRLGSAVDVEATFRKHEPDPAVFGYNAAISTTPTRIRAAVLLPGCTPDSEAPVAVLDQQQHAGQPVPPVLTMDQAGGWGKTRAQVDAVSQGHTRLVALVPQAGGTDRTRFTPDAFWVDPDGTTCRCPAGRTSTRVYRSGAGDGVHFRFRAQDCRDCPLWAQCRAADSQPTSHRTVYVSPYHGYLRDGAAFNRTVDGQALLRQRWQVEPTVAWLVRYDGSRRARRVGRQAAQCHLLQACAGRNLWRYLARVARRRPPAAGAVRP